MEYPDVNKPNGFTLIEILLAIAIIGILSAIAVPTYQRYVHAAKSEDLLVTIHTLRERVAIEKSTGSWSENMVTPQQPGTWPAPLTLSPALLEVPHFITKVSIAQDNRPVAVFIAKDAEGRFIIDEVRKHLPEKLIYGYFNRTLIGVWLMDADHPHASVVPAVQQQPVQQPLLPAQNNLPPVQAPQQQNSSAGSSFSPVQGSTGSQSSTGSQVQTPTPNTQSIVQSTHLPAVTIPPECIKPNGGYYHRNHHRPNCPL